MATVIFHADHYIPGTDEMVEFRADIHEGGTVGRVVAFHYNESDLMIEDADGDRARELVARVFECAPMNVDDHILRAYLEYEDDRRADSPY